MWVNICDAGRTIAISLRRLSDVFAVWLSGRWFSDVIVDTCTGSPVVVEAAYLSAFSLNSTGECTSSETGQSVCFEESAKALMVLQHG